MPMLKVVPTRETAFGGEERRRKKRFPIERAIRCIPKTGATRYGRTVDISSTGVLFAVEDPPSLGQSVELTVDWPVRLNGETHLKLVILGSVIRREPDRAAVAIAHREYRTLGSGALLAHRLLMLNP